MQHAVYKLGRAQEKLSYGCLNFLIESIAGLSVYFKMQGVISEDLK